VPGVPGRLLEQVSQHPAQVDRPPSPVARQGWSRLGVPATTASTSVQVSSVGGHGGGHRVAGPDLVGRPVLMAMTLPLFFISGVLVPWSLVPPWLRDVAVAFPVRHLAQAVLVPFAHGAGQSPWSPTDLAVLVAWGAAGLTVALRRFAWAPRDT